jgi:hypothetical protein
MLVISSEEGAEKPCDTVPSRISRVLKIKETGFYDNIVVPHGFLLDLSFKRCLVYILPMKSGISLHKKREISCKMQFLVLI